VRGRRLRILLATCGEGRWFRELRRKWGLLFGDRRWFDDLELQVGLECIFVLKT
jgi:hypothetical protein